MLARLVLAAAMVAAGMSPAIAGPDEIVTESPRGLSDLYVAITRATRRLGILHTNDLPKVLSSLS